MGAGLIKIGSWWGQFGWRLRFVRSAVDRKVGVKGLVKSGSQRVTVRQPSIQGARHEGEAAAAAADESGGGVQAGVRTKQTERDAQAVLRPAGRCCLQAQSC